MSSSSQTSKRRIVSAVIKFPNGDLLIQNHVKIDGLTLPSGGIEENESPLLAIAREMSEEIDVDISDLMLESIVPILSEVIIHPELSDTEETRFTFNVEDDFTWSNIEPDKHKWIRRLSLDDIKESDIPESIVLSNYTSSLGT